MKKYFLLLLLIPHIIYSEKWTFDSEKRLLFYKGQPFPSYSGVITPIGPFGFVRFGSNSYYFYGWAKVQDSIKIENSSEVEKKIIKKGWFFSKKKPANIPEGWIFFPNTYLWASVEGFFRLYRYWNKYYEFIKLLSREVYNHIKENRFYRIMTPFLDNKVRKVMIHLPENMNLAYKKKLTASGVRFLYIIYSMEKKLKQRNRVDIIKVKYIFNNGRVEEKKYKIVYQKDTKLSYQSY